MSVVVRIVTLGQTPEIMEHFLGFLIAPLAWVCPIILDVRNVLHVLEGSDGGVVN